MNKIDNLWGFDINKVMFGENAINIPLNMYFQHIPRINDQSNKHAGVFQFDYPIDKFKELQNSRSGLLILGDAIIRPRVAIATDACIGDGISSIYTGGFIKVLKSLKTDKSEITFEVK